MREGEGRGEKEGGGGKRAALTRSTREESHKTITKYLFFPSLQLLDLSPYLKQRAQ